LCPDITLADTLGKSGPFRDLPKPFQATKSMIIVKVLFDFEKFTFGR